MKNFSSGKPILPICFSSPIKRLAKHPRKKQKKRQAKKQNQNLDPEKKKE